MNILLVEDEDGLRAALLKELEDEGWKADGAANGEDGLNMLLSGVYDLAVLDIMLPGIDGLQILSRIRAANMTTPVILLTALDRVDDKVKGMDGGADDYLTKPFDLRELKARIRMVLRRHGGSAADNDLHLGNVTLGCDSCVLSDISTGKSIRLAGREFQLMEYLMRNHSRVLTREMITEKIWGFDSDAEYNNVDVYISFIRKKLCYIGADVRIRAVRGVGYILEAEE